MITVAALRALVAAGVPASTIVDAIEADQAAGQKLIEERRARDAARKRRSRMSRGQAAGHAESAGQSGQCVTGRDSADGDPPPSKVPPTPPLITSPSESPDGLSGAAAPKTYTDARHELWGEGPAILVSLGAPAARARPLIGRWLRDTNDDAAGVLAAIRRARAARALDPIPWITCALKPQRSPHHGQRESPFARAAREIRADMQAGPGDEQGGDPARLLPAVHRA